MEIQTVEQLAAGRCVPCEGGVARYSVEQAQQQLENLEGWSLTENGLRIRKEWTVKDFMSGMRFFNEVAKVAEEDGHHPDIGPSIRQPACQRRAGAEQHEAQPGQAYAFAERQPKLTLHLQHHHGEEQREHMVEGMADAQEWHRAFEEGAHGVQSGRK